MHNLTIARIFNEIADILDGEDEKRQKVRTLDRFPIQYATTQNNLGNAYHTLAEVKEKQENCEKAIRVFTAEDFLEVYAQVVQNLRGYVSSVKVSK